MLVRAFGSLSRLDTARLAIGDMVSLLEAAGSEIGEVLRRLQTKSLANNFAVGVFEDVMLVSMLYAFTVGVLTREAKPKKVIWCSDRDRLTTWAGGVIWSLAFVQAFRWCLQFKVQYASENLPTMRMRSDGPDEFDPFIRPPDYLAGALSSWSLDANAGMEGAEKYGIVLREIISRNRNITIHRIRVDDLLHVTHWQVGPRSD